MLERFFPCETGYPCYNWIRIGLLPVAGVFLLLYQKAGTHVGSDEKAGKIPVQQPVTDEAIFKVAKEIVVKFIEVGRLTPSSFDETFERVYRAIERTVRPQ